MLSAAEHVDRIEALVYAALYGSRPEANLAHTGQPPPRTPQHGPASGQATSNRNPWLDDTADGAACPLA